LPVDEQPLEETSIGQRLGSIQVLIQLTYGVLVDGKKVLALVLNHVHFEQRIQLWLVRECRTPGHGHTRRGSVKERAPWRLASAEVLEDTVLDRAGLGKFVAFAVIDVDGR
jgi:hypothetical protein